MDKSVYQVKDFEEMLCVGYSTACRIMRQAKAFRDTLKIRGLILKEDWEAYIQFKSNQTKD